MINAHITSLNNGWFRYSCTNAAGEIITGTCGKQHTAIGKMRVVSRLDGTGESFPITQNHEDDEK